MKESKVACGDNMVERRVPRLWRRALYTLPDRYFKIPAYWVWVVVCLEEHMLP